MAKTYPVSVVIDEPAHDRSNLGYTIVSINHEDAAFKGYLLEYGWDISRMGLAGADAPMESDAESSRYNAGKMDQ